MADVANAAAPAEAPDPNQAFFDKAQQALRELYDKAQAAIELHFMMALMAEMRGMQDAGWNTAEEAIKAFDQYRAILQLITGGPERIRVILAFYMHVAEGSDFYEVPKKMLLTIEGKGNSISPFSKLVKKHKKSGHAIAPNANAVMKDMMGHAFELGMRELAQVFEEAFDGDIRNAIAHADYTLAPEGMRLRRRNGGTPRVIAWNEFEAIINRGLSLFSIIRDITGDYITGYHPPKVIQARLSSKEPIGTYCLYYAPNTGVYGFRTGDQPPPNYNQALAPAAPA